MTPHNGPIKSSAWAMQRIRNGKPLSVTSARSAIRFCAWMIERLPEYAGDYAAQALVLAPYAIGKRA